MIGTTSTLLVKYYQALLSVFMSVILFGFVKSWLRSFLSYLHVAFRQDDKAISCQARYIFLTKGGGGGGKKLTCTKKVSKNPVDASLVAKKILSIH